MPVMSTSVQTDNIKAVIFPSQNRTDKAPSWCPVVVSSNDSYYNCRPVIHVMKRTEESFVSAANSDSVAAARGAEVEHVDDALAETDERIEYPCYKSFDEFIDVERLKALDAYIAERIERHRQQQRDTYFLNAHRLKASTPHRPGVREIWLTAIRPGVPYNYLDLDKPELWQLTEAAEEFAELLAFIRTLPFKATARILIIYDDQATEVPPHRDHLYPEICHEFIWMRTNRRKPFYMLNHASGEKRYVESYSAWFDSVNQFHGSDAAEGLSFSIRVDGLFTDEFRRLIPLPDTNPASTPALWSCLSKLESERGGADAERLALNS